VIGKPDPAMIGDWASVAAAKMRVAQVEADYLSMGRPIIAGLGQGAFCLRIEKELQGPPTAFMAWPCLTMLTIARAIALRSRAKFIEIGVYNPAGAQRTGKSQVCDAAGIDFPIDTPPLLMAEGSYKYNQDARCLAP
jgi:hypothetical protein